jgi:hypothetical protein
MSGVFINKRFNSFDYDLEVRPWRAYMKETLGYKHTENN